MPTGTRATLRSVAGTDTEWLWELLSHPEVLPYWRFRGVMPSPEQFHAMVWSGVSDQMLICSSTNNPVGLVTAYGTDNRAGNTHVAVAMHPNHAASMWAFEGVLLFLDHLFQTFPLRKIYFEVTERRAGIFQRNGGLARLTRLEGVLRESLFENGTVVDQYIYSIDREPYLAIRAVR